VTDLLVVGYGNDLRCDDGAGRHVADAIEEMELPGVMVRSVAQLTPELALDIAGRDCVVFVDASVDTEALTHTAVAPGSGPGGVMTHHGDPSHLLSLVESVGPLPAEATVISIPALNLGLGFDLSPATAAGVSSAIDLVAALAARSAGHS
jgi:hydrogenase maturation protease